MREDGRFVIPVVASGDGAEFTFRAVRTNDGKEWPAAFTSPAEYHKEQPGQIVSNSIDAMLIGMIIKADGGVECRPALK